MKAARKIVTGLLMLIAFVFLESCSEQSGWGTSMSGIPVNSVPETGESNQVPSGMGSAPSYFEIGAKTAGNEVDRLPGPR
jgi:hypothetical protein